MQEIGAEGFSGTAVPYGGWLVRRTSPALRTALLLTGATGSSAAFIVSDESPPSEDETGFWNGAIERAENAMRTTDSDVPWVAIVGPAFDSLRQADCLLTDQGNVGSIVLEPLATAHFDYVQQDPYFILGSGIRAFRSHPIMVRGAVRTFSWWENGTHLAGKQLARITAILALATGYHWVIRMPPDLIRQQGPLTLPLRSPAFAVAEPILEDQDHIVPVPFAITPWMENAWSLVDRDQAFSDALFAYAEGMSLREQHPSFAHLSFVAAIEAIGSRYVESERCSCCDDCRITIGATKQFRHAAMIVMSKRELGQLDPYTKRSGTAHSGTLYGFETAGGITQSPRFFQSQPEHSFSATVVPRLAEVTAALLRHVAEEGADDDGG